MKPFMLAEHTYTSAQKKKMRITKITCNQDSVFQKNTTLRANSHILSILRYLISKAQWTVYMKVVNTLTEN